MTKRVEAGRDDPVISSAALYGRIWQATGRTQLLLIALSIALSALAAVPLHYQRELVNGFAYGTSRERILSLGAQFAAVVLLTVLIKFGLQYRAGLVGEDVARRLRKRIASASMNATGQQGREPPAAGTVASMLTAETESVGQFVGEAFSTPIVQIGTLVSVLLYITASEPLLGLIATTLVIPQIAIVAVVQRRVNVLVRKRLALLRKAADETIAASGDTVLARFDEVYETRRRIYWLKTSSKSVLKTLTGLASVAILVFGALLVLRGESDIGTVVAALSGLTRLTRPWSELVTFYRSLSIVKVRSELLEGAVDQMEGGAVRERQA